MGRYHPPASLDSSLSNKRSSGFNQTASGRSTQATGPPTIRFEMPFAIWCTTCTPDTIIGQGVRFNARKTRVGNYYSTPVWAFEMRHPACGGLIEIRTDPKNSEYVVTRGAKKRDYGADDDGAGEGLLGTVIPVEEKERRAADPFASLEGKVDEGIKAKNENWWVEKLKEDRDRDWDDVWSANRRLRKTFRKERKILQAKDRNREELSDRLGLSIDVLDEVEEDGQRAALVSFGESEETANQKVITAAARPLFDDKTSAESIRIGKEKNTKAQVKSEKTKALLQQSLQSSTRAVVDPFLTNGSGLSKSSGSLISGIKRKRSLGVSMEQSEKTLNNNDVSSSDMGSKVTEASATILVDYNSDESESCD